MEPQRTDTSKGRSLLRKGILPLLLTVLLAAATLGNSGCGIYKFNDTAIPDSVRSIKIHYIDNRAPYVNPQLAPALTERLRRKLMSQTRLQVTNDDAAHLVVRSVITDYSVSTSGISNREAALNRLTVTARVSVTDTRNPNAPPKELDVSRSFDFSSSRSLQAAEAELADEMTRSLTDDIFNRLFSEW